MEGTIYKIQSTQGPLCYIGSTRHPLKDRLTHHFCRYKQFKNGHTKSRVAVFDLMEQYDHESISIVPVESGTFEDRYALEKKEMEYVQATEHSVNKKRGVYGSTKDIQAYRKAYFTANQEKHRAHMRKVNRERVTCPQCGIEYLRGNKTNHTKTKKHQQSLVSSADILSVSS